MRFLSSFRVVLAAALAAAAALPLCAAPKEDTPDPATRLLRDASLMLLKEGNVRYVTGKQQHPHVDAERRATTLAEGQEPFATILACSDSREPVELIFDRGVGDLFVVRVAGNVAGLSELATVEYGVSHLNTPLLVVMGHSKCDAVTAVVKGTELHGHLQALAEKIKPAADRVKAETPEPEEAVTKAIQANVWQTIEDIIKQSSAVREKVHAGRLSILGAVYDLEQGKVSWLGLHPAQDSLVALADQAGTDAALAKKLAAGTEPPAAGTGAAVNAGPAAGAAPGVPRSSSSPATAATRRPLPVTARERTESVPSPFQTQPQPAQPTSPLPSPFEPKNKFHPHE
ncbi:MAG TPA: carbonic anhydrase [Verrucomicrobiae bacterium]|nr:carbonic anhydrase [Verrucomicrobiae bacterium]